MADDRIVIQCCPVREAYHGRQHFGFAPAVLDDGGFVDLGRCPSTCSTSSGCTRYPRTLS